MKHGPHTRYANGRPSQALEAENRRLRVRVTELERENADGVRLVAVAAHELVEPLIATEAYASIVAGRLEGDVHAESRNDLDTLRRGSAHARVLVEALLHHGDTAERPLRRRPIDVGLVVRDCLRLLAPEVDFREVRLEVGELPVVAGEETLIRSLITNLLSNALKYGPRYGGTIAISATQLGGDWRFCVRRPGSTIPSRIASASSMPTAEDGASAASAVGLGLAICRRIVERHGGRIWVGPAHGTGNESSSPCRPDPEPFACADRPADEGLEGAYKRCVRHPVRGTGRRDAGRAPHGQRGGRLISRPFAGTCLVLHTGAGIGSSGRDPSCTAPEKEPPWSAPHVVSPSPSTVIVATLPAVPARSSAPIVEVIPYDSIEVVAPGEALGSAPTRARSPSPSITRARLLPDVPRSQRHADPPAGPLRGLHGDILGQRPIA